MTASLIKKRILNGGKQMIAAGLLAPILISLSEIAVRADEALPATIDSDCSRLLSPQDVIDCALSNHPEAQRAILSSRQAESLEAAAGQRPNPEIGGRSLFGSSLGDDVVNHEVNLAFTVEMGSKRGARVERATAERETVLAHSTQSKEEVLLATIHGLYRLRQIKAELHTIEEALETFARIQNLFRSRLRRTPEQEVSLGVFGIAEGDYQLRKANLDTELETHIQEIGLAIGREFKPSTGLLPIQRTVWPSIGTDATPPTAFKGSAISAARADLKLAEADLSVAQSLAWPDFKIGPSYERQTSGPIAFQTFGVNLSFALPVFQTNGGGRAVARAGLDLAERGLSLTEREISNQRRILLKKYSTSVKAIEKSPTHADIERKHRNTDALFARGIIPSSLVIEAHRQIVDFTKSQNEMELSAIEALWKIYILEGRAFEEKL